MKNLGKIIFTMLLIAGCGKGQIDKLGSPPPMNPLFGPNTSRPNPNQNPIQNQNAGTCQGTGGQTRNGYPNQRDCETSWKLSCSQQFGGCWAPVNTAPSPTGGGPTISPTCQGTGGQVRNGYPSQWDCEASWSYTVSCGQGTGGCWSPGGPRQAPPPVTTNAPLNNPWSNDEWRNYVFSLLGRGGPLASPQGLAAIEPELVARGAILQRNSAHEIRGRIYLPSPGKPYDRAVDIGDFGMPWQWIVR